MKANASLWRTFVTIVQIVAFVAFAIPSAVHALAADRLDCALHAATAGHVHEHAAPHDHEDTASAATTLAEHGAIPQASGLACLGCAACVAFVPAPAPVATAHGPQVASVITPVRAAGPLGVTPEALPEPPRPLA